MMIASKALIWFK